MGSDEFYNTGRKTNDEGELAEMANAINGGPVKNIKSSMGSNLKVKLLSEVS